MVVGQRSHNGRAVTLARFPQTPSWRGRSSQHGCTTSSWSHRSAHVVGFLKVNHLVFLFYVSIYICAHCSKTLKASFPVKVVVVYFNKNLKIWRLSGENSDFFFPNTKSSKLVTITRNNHLHLILQLRHILLKFTHGHISLWTIEVFSQLQFLVFFLFFIYILMKKQGIN